MKGIVPPDPETKVSQVHSALVYTRRRSRKRFPAGCVQIMDTEEEAIIFLSFIQKGIKFKENNIESTANASHLNVFLPKDKAIFMLWYQVLIVLPNV